MKHQQHTIMKFDPATGEERPYPSNADDWRSYHGRRAWLLTHKTMQRVMNDFR